MGFCSTRKTFFYCCATNTPFRNVEKEDTTCAVLLRILRACLGYAIQPRDIKLMINAIIWKKYGSAQHRNKFRKILTKHSECS